MFTQTKRTKPRTKQDSETDFSSDSDYDQFANEIPFVSNILQPFQFEAVFPAGVIQAKKLGVAEQRVCVCGGGGGVRPDRHLFRGGNFARQCISTTPIGAPIYIWPLAAIPPAPSLKDGTNA